MLSIGKLVVGQQRYYEQQVAQGRDDYYSGRGEAPGRWIGAVARTLGLHGRVTAAAFNALIAGRDPRDDTKRLRDGPAPKVAALDLTFSAPKSVSVLLAVADQDVGRELVEAHEAAVREAVAWLEDRAVQVRRGAGGNVRAPGVGFIAAAYRHRMSRALDPQLHTHVVAANLARGPDERYTALFGAPLYQAAKTAGFLYQAHLRAEVRDRLGLEWGPVRKGAAELAAIPAAVLGEFSRRRHEMERAAAAGGFSLSTKRSAEAAAVDTRDRKQYGIDTHTWREEIEARAAEHGLDRHAIEVLVAHDKPGERTGDQENAADLASLEARLAGDVGLTERANAFDRRPVLQAFAEAAQQGARIGVVNLRADRFCDRGDVVRLVGRDFTTAGLVDCERRLVAAAAGRAGEGCAVIPAEACESRLSSLEYSPTAEQADVIRHVVTDGNGVSIVEALAGTGKTYAAGVLREIYEAAGHAVLGVAPTARAARELTEQAGIRARTIDRMLIDIEQQGVPLPPHSVIVLDESGMAPTRLTARLLEHAADASAKVVAFGDSRQLPSVLAGGWLRAVGERVGSHRLTEVLRQRSPRERRALAALHDGIPGTYLRWAAENDRIDLCEPDARDRCAIERWAAAVAEHGPAQAVLIARDNETRAGLNAAARECRRGLGELGAERRFGPVDIAVSDRIICRSNESRIDVDNGTRGTVRHVDETRIVVESDSGLIRELPAAYVADHVEHAYCLTGHGMQGGTVEQAIVVAEPPDLTAGWSYTALSRARGETHLLLPVDARPMDPDRGELGPTERIPHPSRTELLRRVERRMRERDDEDLAIERLLPPGHEGDRALSRAARFMAVPHQERGAATADEADPGATRRRLADLCARLARLETALAALPLRSLNRFDQLDTHLTELVARREARAEELGSLRTSRGLRPARGSDNDRAVFLRAAVASDHRTIAEFLAARQQLTRELGDPDQVRSERAATGVELDRCRSEINDLLDNLAAGEVVAEPEWATNSLGHRPPPGRNRETWDGSVHQIARYRLKHDVDAPDAALGPEPSDQAHRREWATARQALQRAQRSLGIRLPDRGLDTDRSID